MSQPYHAAGPAARVRLFFGGRITTRAMPTPLDPALYAAVKAEAKRRFRRWPSAYGSAWLAKEYARRGGKYASPRAESRRGSRRSSRKGSRSRSRRGSRDGVARWMREQWVQVGPWLDTGAAVPCGAAGRDGRACRPLRRVSPRSAPTLPELVRKHGKAKLRSLARRKSREMRGRVDWVQARFTSPSQR